MSMMWKLDSSLLNPNHLDVLVDIQSHNCIKLITAQKTIDGCDYCCD